MPADNNREVILLHPNIESVATPFHDLLSRINEYSHGIQQVTKSDANKLVLLMGISKSRFIEQDPSKFDALNIVRVTRRSRISILFSVKALFYIRKNFDKNARITLVAGDLRSSLVPIFFCKFILRNRVKTQISIHGHFIKNRSRLDFMGAILNWMVGVAIRNADSIRVVSKHLAAEVTNQFPSSYRKIFISPVPINTGIQSKLPPRTFNNAIAIVGRLHRERGILEALELVKIALLKQDNLKLLVVGDGPLEGEVRKWIASSNLGIRVHLIGKLTQVEIMNFWLQADVLVNNSETEGYGMAMREAALHGCRIVARRNPGSNELFEQYGDVIYLYDNELEFLSCLESALLLQKSPTAAIQLREAQRLADSKAMALLIDSWLAD